MNYVKENRTQENLQKRFFQVEEVPTLPGIAVKIIEVSADPESSLLQLAEVIEMDPGLSARILRFSNAAFFGFQAKITTVRRALSLLGIRMVRSLALSVKVMQLFNKDKYPDPERVGRLWIHNIACGLLAERLSRKVDYPQPDEAFMAGLLHDIGKIVLVDQFPEKYLELLRQAEENQQPIQHFEKAHFGFTHAQVAKQVMEYWAMPASLTETVHLHHQPHRDAKPENSLPAIVQAANDICCFYGIGASFCPVEIHQSGMTAEAVRANLESEELEQLVTEVLQNLEEFGEILGIRPDSHRLYLEATKTARQALDKMNFNLNQTVEQLRQSRKLWLAAQTLNENIPPRATAKEAFRAVTEALRTSLGGHEPALCLIANQRKNRVDGWLMEDSKAYSICLQLEDLMPLDGATLDRVVDILIRGKSNKLNLPQDLRTRLCEKKLIGADIRDADQMLGRLYACNRPETEDSRITTWQLEQFAHLCARVLKESMLRSAMLNQSEQLIRLNKETEEIEMQLVHAERLASIGIFAMETAHDLRTPLSVISAETEMLLQNIEDEKVRSSLENILKQTRTVTHNLDNMIGFARKPSSRDLWVIKISEMVKECVELLRHRMKKSKVEIREIYAPDLPSILVDPQQILQVFLNLIMNAFQAMNGRGGALEIIGRHKPKTNEVEIRFRDTGPGIPDEQLERIFEPFFTTKSEQQGTGLGLSICKRIITNHGGSIRAESRPGKGATLIITLPTNCAEKMNSKLPASCSETEDKPSE